MNKIINLGVLAHVDAGKTTTVEHILYKCGAVKALGRVDDGTAHTDWLEVEQKRGISVRSSSSIVNYNDIQINIIDTPGHVDFSGEVERALSVLDSAVLVISAVEGIQSHTEIIWKALSDLNIPVIIFVNKIDRVGCSCSGLIENMKKELSENLILLNRVCGEGSRECSLKDESFSEDDISLVCGFYDDLTTRFLDGDKIKDDEINEKIVELVSKRDVFPVVFGSAALGLGIDTLLDKLTCLLPKTELKTEGEPKGVIYKIEHDKLMGKVAHIRLFDGCIKNRDTIKLANSQAGIQKVTQIRKIYGNKFQDTGVLYGGDIAAVCGLSEAKTGDIIGDMPDSDRYKLAVPLFTVRVLPDKIEKLTSLAVAISELSDEDPLLDFEWIPEKRELIIKIMGTIQLEVLGYLLSERYNLSVSFTPPSVIYKETPKKSGRGFEAYTMPKPCWAVVELMIEPLPRGSGFQYESIVKDRDIFERYQNHIAASVPEALKQGLHGWEVTDLKVTLIGGQHHILHTHPLDFFLATPIAVMRGLTDSQTELLEPILKVNIIADEEFSGKIIGDVIAMRGEFESPVISGGKFMLECRLPVATSMDYPVRLASVTSGRGIMKTEFCGYKECPLELGKTTERRGINPLDRAKWILHKRSAISD